MHRVRLATLALVPALLASPALAAPNAPPIPGEAAATPATAAPAPKADAAKGEAAPAESRKLAWPALRKKPTADFLTALGKGVAASTSGDTSTAIAELKKCVASEPQNAIGYYYLGEAQLASGNLSDAEASWANGLRNSGSDDVVTAKLLFVTADLRERQQRWEEAKVAWTDYDKFVGAHPGANVTAGVGGERAKIVATHVELATKSAGVKKRIEDRLRKAGGPPPDTGPTGAKKK